MSNTPLPSQLDIRKLVVKGAEISAETPISTLPRFVDLLANEEGSIAVSLQFYIDEERFRRVDGHIGGTVEVFCQRCLEPMPLALDIRFQLAVVWSEDDAERLPASLEPLIVGEELVDLADIVSDELILGLPFVSYHEVDSCQQPGHYAGAGFGAEADVAAANLAVAKGVATNVATNVATTEARDNPFKVLERIKFDK